MKCGLQQVRVTSVLEAIRLYTEQETEERPGLLCRSPIMESVAEESTEMNVLGDGLEALA